MAKHERGARLVCEVQLCASGTGRRLDVERFHAADLARPYLIRAAVELV
jgi:hypothetical protein